jgi:NAD(P)-dependent dehydrogenase (short-subunit alcohol dehydrogenase family)
VRIIGILGGLGPESTIDYYRSILARYRARTQNDGYPQIIINSLDVDKGIASGTELALLLRDSEADTADDIASAALFLASNDSRWITGEEILVGGGIRL